MGTFSVGGLATGLDTRSIVDQLLAIDSRPKVKLEWNKALWEARKSGWGDLNTRLNSLQGFANTLNNPSTWTVFTGITSSDPTRVTAASAGTKPQSGTYSIDVTQLAATEVWDASLSLAGPTAGVRETGIWYRGAGLAANAGTLITGLRSPTGGGLGLGVNSTINLNWEQGGNTHSSTFLVTATTTLGDLRSWAQGQVPGSTFTLNGSGSITITSPTGTDDEVTSLSFTARNSAGTALNAFNGTPGANSAMLTAAGDGGATADDTLVVTQGSSTWYVNVNEGDNEAAIVNKVNAVTGIGVTASISGGLLKLTANDSGAADSFTVTSSGTLAADLGLAETTAGQDSAFSINGTGYTRSRNTGITDVLTDVSIDLLNTTGASVSLTVGQAAATVADMKKKILDFVNQYNEVIDFVGSKTSEKRVINPKNLSEFLQGPLSHDFGFSTIASDLRRQATDSVTGLPAGFSMLADIGITTGAIGAGTSATSGKLVVDEAKLEAALNTDATKVRDIFQKVGGGPVNEDGIAKRISNMVSQWRVGGRVDSALEGASSQIDRLQDSIDRFSQRLERKRAYYERMFSALEAQVGKMQSQGSWLSGQLAGLSSGGAFG